MQTKNPHFRAGFLFLNIEIKIGVLEDELLKQ